MIRVLLVDDETRVRAGLRMQLALEPDIEVAGEAQDAPSALAGAAALDPDVILLDVRMPGGDGISALAQLRSAAPRSSVVVLSLHDDAATRARAAAAGAYTFVGKHEPADVLLAAIRSAAAPLPPAARRSA